jgi:hypothetical protein
MTYINQILIIIVLILFISCKESPLDSPSPAANYLPLKIGNYWIYNSYRKDMNNNYIPNTIITDSIVVEIKEKIQGHDAFYLIRYRDNIPIDTIIAANHENFLYLLFDSSNTYIPQLQRKWLPVIDYSVDKEQQWNIFKTVFYNYPIVLDGNIYPSTYWHTINGEYVYADSIEINGLAVFSKKYINKYDSWLDASILWKFHDIDSTSYYDTLKYTKYMKYYDKYHIAEGIGFYKIQRDSYIINTVTEPSTSFTNVIEVNGEESILKRYKILK